MPRWFWKSLIATAALAAPAAGQAAWPDSARVVLRADSVFAQFDNRQSPGCALAVMRDGRIVYGRGYGMANLEHGIPITTQTVFDIGSTSKQITAMSLALLAQEELLSLDDDIRKYVPEVPDYGTRITMRHLLHHTSGLRDYTDLLVLQGFRIEDVATEADALTVLARQKGLNFRPGAEHLYSNSGYFLASVIVKRVTGKTLREFAHENIFVPLGMRDTHYHDDHTMIVARRATGYAPMESGGFRSDMSDWEQLGDGAVMTTVEDLARWDENFYSGRVGGQSALTQLQTPGALNGGERLTYAHGLVVDRYRGLRRVSHGGAWAGYRAELMRLPERHVSVATLCNLASTDPTGMAAAVADVFLDDAMQPPATSASARGGGPQPVAERVPERALGRYVGVYLDDATGSVRRIILRDGKLLYERSPGNSTELTPFDAGRFLIRGVPARVELTFESSRAGGPMRMYLKTGNDRPSVYVAVKPAILQRQALAEYRGRYYSAEVDAAYTVQVRDDRLVLRHARLPDVVLEPVTADVFTGEPGLVRFTRAAGRIAGLTLTNRGVRRFPFAKEAGGP